MQDTSNVSSEEELLQLRNEGKISEDEYEELRSAMRKSTKLDVEPPAAAAGKAKSKRKLGKIAFILMLVGMILPAFCFLLVIRVIPLVISRSMILPWLISSVGLEIAAFVMGVIGWPDVLAKATVVTISSITVLAFLFALLTVA